MPTTRPYLTKRERQVLIMTADGATKQEIAEMFGMSVKTVEKHREHLMQKLDLHNTAGLTRYAASAGLIL